MDNSRFVYKNGKSLRTGYTTGSCAAAASKAAVMMLLSGQLVDKVEIDTPKGWRLKLDVLKPVIKEGFACCCIIKDSGDDPDITNGIEVYAKARKSQNTSIEVKAGQGIGTVTREGLSVKPGSPAINPVPMQMILKEVTEVLPDNEGVEIELSIPKGEELAKKTYNPKLGIVGGISIIGTSGIVEPMSEDAIKDTIALELSYCRSSGFDSLVLVPGNYGEEFCKKWLDIPGSRIVKISNYLGFALEKCAELGFKRLLLAGHIGKLVKTAGGIFYTHSRISDTRMEIITAFLGIMGANQTLLKEIMECRTTEEALPAIDNNGYKAVYDMIAEKCSERCEAYVYNSLEVGSYVFSMKGLLAKSLKSDSILEEVLNEQN